jgi:hypothetical protein
MSLEGALLYVGRAWRFAKVVKKRKITCSYAKGWVRMGGKSWFPFLLHRFYVKTNNIYFKNNYVPSKKRKKNLVTSTSANLWSAISMENLEKDMQLEMQMLQAEKENQVKKKCFFVLGKNSLKFSDILCRGRQIFLFIFVVPRLQFCVFGPPLLLRARHSASLCSE